MSGTHCYFITQDLSLSNEFPSGSCFVLRLNSFQAVDITNNLLLLADQVAETTGMIGAGVQANIGEAFLLGDMPDAFYDALEGQDSVAVKKHIDLVMENGYENDSVLPLEYTRALIRPTSADSLSISFDLPDGSTGHCTQSMTPSKLYQQYKDDAPEPVGYGWTTVRIIS